jgi:L-alanine-DL-glutamate epimerase-like enolase superfamily enzyme
VTAVLSALRIARLRPQSACAELALPGWALPAMLPMPTWPENEARWVLEAVASTGATGRFGPCTGAQVAIIRDQLAPGTIGQPLDDLTEGAATTGTGRFRHGPHFRSAVAALDLAMVDLRGVEAGCPAFAGDDAGDATVTAYATLLSIDVHHPLAADIARWATLQGFAGTKWPLRPDDAASLPRWVDAMEAIASNTGCALFVDALGCIPPDHLAAALRAIRELGVEWIEEPGCTAAWADAVAVDEGVRWADGEHAFEDADFQSLMACRALSVWQPEISWHGLSSATLRRTRSMFAAGRTTIPHGAHLPATLAMASALGAEVVPMVEFNVCLEPRRHGHLVDPPLPRNGHFEVSAGRTGLSVEYDVVGVAEAL